MQTVVGYYDWHSDEKSSSDIEYFVHCCGRYKLINKEHFITFRPDGTANYQLIYIAEGMGHFQVGGAWHHLEKGNCILYCPEDAQRYEYYLKDHPVIYWVHFSCREKPVILQSSQAGGGRILRVGSHSTYLQLFDTMIHELQIKQPFFEEQLQLLIQQLLNTMRRNCFKEKSVFESYNKEVEDAIRLFHIEPEKEFTIRDFTKDRGLNYYRFIDTFSRYTGVSPRQYIINIRMTMAKDLLMNTDFQILEISQIAGYENPLYFSRLFKKNCGMSPTEYRIKNM